MAPKAGRYRPTRGAILREVDEAQEETVERRILRILEEQSDETEQTFCYIRSHCVAVSLILKRLFIGRNPLWIPCPEDEKRRANMPPIRKDLSLGNRISIYPLTEEEYCLFIEQAAAVHSFERGYSIFSKYGAEEWTVREFPAEPF